MMGSFRVTASSRTILKGLAITNPELTRTKTPPHATKTACKSIHIQCCDTSVKKDEACRDVMCVCPLVSVCGWSMKVVVSPSIVMGVGGTLAMGLKWWSLSKGIGDLGGPFLFFVSVNSDLMSFWGWGIFYHPKFWYRDSIILFGDNVDDHFAFILPR